MILNSTVENPAILSNVGQVGEFRIRNSAKAFNILSSGLYANKIRAIIRELSCNAVDSHVAAGTTDTPFEVHLPNQLEPYFAVRDFGTGLNHEQVTNIYTTYFESTKTTSNEFIGALGLGSKSPFSYTDNFTVTAIQGGVKRIYSAFINEEGVPSIALMDTAGTAERNGVEVKFSVNDQWDYSKFRDEARSVFTYFRNRPAITGMNNFQFNDVEYVERDIIPGVHQARSRRSMAVMGNIAYPVEVPNAESNLGDLARLLNCGLEMHFDIGELDFQASREGLSYIPSTIDSIRTKLVALNAKLADHVVERANAKTNLWERAIYLAGIASNDLWSAAVRKYAADTDFVFADPTNRYGFLKSIQVAEEDLRTQYNLVIRAFSTRQGYANKTKNIKADGLYFDDQYKQGWAFMPSNNVVFVKNDTKTGAANRAKFHYGQIKQEHRVYVLEAWDRKRPALFDQFLAAIHNPPSAVFASSLSQQERERANMNKVGVLRLNYNDSYDARRRSRTVSWDRDHGTVFTATDTYYYLPLSNFEAECRMDVEQLKTSLMKSGLDDVSKITIYGVRKSHFKEVSENPNWVNVEQFLEQRMAKISDADLEQMALNLVDGHEVFSYTRDNKDKLNPNSPMRQLIERVAKKTAIKDFDPVSLERLLNKYGRPTKIEQFVTSIQKECDSVLNRYPLLKSMNSYRVDRDAVTQYINLIDNNQ